MASFNSYKQDTSSRLASLETEVKNVYIVLDDIRNNHLVHLRSAVDDLTRLVLGRPTWLSSIIVTILTAIVAAFVGAHFG